MTISVLLNLHIQRVAWRERGEGKTGREERGDRGEGREESREGVGKVGNYFTCSQCNPPPAAMHNTFQRDLYRLRLEVARSYVKAVTASLTPITSSQDSSLKISAQVCGRKREEGGEGWKRCESSPNHIVYLSVSCEGARVGTSLSSHRHCPEHIFHFCYWPHCDIQV